MTAPPDPDRENKDFDTWEREQHEVERRGIPADGGYDELVLPDGCMLEEATLPPDDREPQRVLLACGHKTMSRGGWTCCPECHEWS